MNTPSWRLGAAVAVLVAAVAAILHFAPAGGEADTPAAAGESHEASADDDGEAGEGGAARRSFGAAAANPGAAAIPPGLPPVDRVDPPAYATGLPDGVLFMPDEEARGHFADKLAFGAEDRDYIEFNRAALATLAVGSELSLRTPDNGVEHRLRVYEVQVHPNGDKSWMARVVDASGEVLPAVFTQGVDSTLGNITTNAGTYSLEAEGRLGWIANVNDLRKHQDFNIPDVMEPGPGEGRAPVPVAR